MNLYKVLECQQKDQNKTYINKNSLKAN